jgi:myo-inositol-1(or 4)-monophosphatase
MIEGSVMLKEVMRAVKLIAHEEIMPRYLKVARQHKSDGSLCTEADLAAQEALAKALSKIGDFPVLGEEMPPEVQKELWQAGHDGIWCVDPIDGTSNFVNGLPYFAVSVALMRKGKSVLGVVYDPVADEIFYAERGKGAYLNGESLPIKEYTPELGRAMAGVDFKRLPGRLAQQLAGAPPYSSQRNYGASTLDAMWRQDVSMSICMVAKSCGTTPPVR